MEGLKQTDNKLDYELDRYYIEAMAKRMKQNKGKYPPYNRQKPMDIEKLKQALFRYKSNTGFDKLIDYSIKS